MGLKDTLLNAGIGVTEEELGVATRKDVATPKPMNRTVTNGDKEKALQLGVIPEAFKDVEFDLDRLKNSIMKMAIKEQFRIAKFNDYEHVLCGILHNLKAGILPNRSWLIGAPKGFGKLEFVIDSLKVMSKNMMSCVPYISLTELADKKYLKDKEISKSEAVRRNMKTSLFSDEKVYINSDTGREIRKVVNNITEIFSWSDYISADLVFCHFTTVNNKEIESMTLKTLLDIRGNKGLPTVVFMDMALEAYTQNDKMREWIWEPILSKEDGGIDRYSTIKHVSSYKLKGNVMTEITEIDLKKDLGM